MRIPILQNYGQADDGDYLSDMIYAVPPAETPKLKSVKRHPLNMRTTKELRDKVERAAKLSGRSLVQEVEYRLERSFWEDEVRDGLPSPLDSK